ncbi:unnamed protein product [Parnassius apollo]|uniref:(apollo) hypothetical protein n=1 Tax=Parnassius apollo TaxID=110799 RepID=A0A8S3YAN8_PARAO|nr:unnamed protein product [Parnassius apollo]
MQCVSCLKPVTQNELLTCTACKLHLHYRCANYTSADFREHKDSLKKSFMCGSCTQITRRYRNDNTPISKAQPSKMLKSPGPQLDIEKSPNHTPKQLTYEEVSNLLDTKLKDEIPKILTSLITSQKKELEDIKVNFKEIQQSNSNIENNIALLTTQNEELRRKL